VNLITGGTGIVGARVLFDLARTNQPVRAIRRLNSDLDFVKTVFKFLDPAAGESLFRSLNWVEAELLDLDSLERALDKVEKIYHAAAMVSYHPADADKMLKVNGEGTANLVNLSLSAGVKKICHISSVAALGSNKSGAPITEKNDWTRDQNRSTYGLSKFNAEREVWRGTMEGLPAIILNPSIIIGPSKPDQSSGMLFQTLRAGVSAFPQGAGGFVDVKDVSQAAIWLMNSDIENERFVVNGENLTYQELLTRAAILFGNKKPRKELKPWMLEMAWRVYAVLEKLGGEKAKVTKETARSASRKQVYDNSKLKAIWPGKFTPISESLEYYRSFGAN